MEYIMNWKRTYHVKYDVCYKACNQKYYGKLWELQHSKHQECKDNLNVAHAHQLKSLSDFSDPYFL